MKCDYKYCIYYDNKKCTHKKIELRGTRCITGRVITLPKRYLDPPPKKRGKIPTN
ncbi:MAG: hypothetical protein FWC89_01860 [Defluviitaleaceae bacterium]|nr:hypothetical protein [Defluviitaleaceae bacterium]